VKNNSGVVIHLIELIDAADSSVGEHKSSGLENSLFSLRIFCDVDSQTDGGRAFSGSVNTSRSDFMNVLEDLGFGSRWVSNEKNVDLSSESASSTLLE
jgi:hypothetical protein